MINKLMTFVNSIPELYAQLSFGVCVLLFVIYFIFDIIYAKYIISVSKLRALRSANYSAVLQILSVIGTLKFVDNVLYTVPILGGIWLGTYLSLKLALNKKISGKKNKKNKK